MSVRAWVGFVVLAAVIAGCGGDDEAATGRGSSAVTTSAVSTAAVADTSMPINAPAGDAFYKPPDPLPPGEPGEIIRSVAVGGIGGAQSWRVLYHSRAIDGRDIAVSGVVIAPTVAGPSGGRPVVALAHGTTGMADECAPSKEPGFDIPLFVLQPLLDAGYVIAATDYEGLGTPGLHPYLVGESEGRGVLDSVRAARELRDANASPRTILFGHSQGGQAVLFAGELAPDYAPDLDVLGVVAAAPLTSPVDAIQPAAAFPGGLGYVVMIVKGLEAAYPQVNAASLFADAGRADSEIVDRQCDVVAAYAGRAAGDVFVRSPLDVPEWRALLEKSVVGPDRLDVPVLVVKGDADQILPKPLTDVFVQSLCAASDQIDYRVYRGANHSSVVVTSMSDVMTWIEDRAADKAFESNC